ncbi:hypothetical protein ES703_20846 [subsurface metagenome]
MVGMMIKASEIFNRIEIDNYPKRINAIGYFKDRIYLPKEKIILEIDKIGKKLVKEMKNDKAPVKSLKEIKEQLIQLVWLKIDILDLLWEKF